MNRLNLCYLLLIYPTFLLAQEQFTVSTTVPLSLAIKELSHRTGYTIYFMEEWLDNDLVIKVPDTPDSMNSILTLCLNSGLKIILLSEKKFVIIPDNLPQVIHVDPGSSDVIIGRNLGHLTGNESLIKGKVTNGNTGEPLPLAGVAVQETGKGSVSDRNGNFELSLPRGNYTLMVSRIGFIEFKKSVSVLSDGNIDLELFTDVYELEEVDVISNRLVSSMNNLQIGSSSINISRIKQIPSFMGETDVIKSIGMMPGVSNSGESSSGLTVRGGNPDQNLFLVDGVPLFNTSHLFGFFTAINPDMVKELSLYKGNIPASMGGRLSSIVEIKLNDELSPKPKVNASSGLISSRIKLSIPLKREKSTLLLSGRTSYSDFLLQNSGIKELQNSGAGFYDLNAKFIQKLKNGNLLKTSAYSSRDQFRFRKESEHAYGTDYFTFDYILFSRSRMSNAISAFYSGFHTELSELGDSLKSSEYKSGIELFSLNYNGGYFPSQNHKIYYGVNNILYSFQMGERSPLNLYSSVPREKLNKKYGLESALYVGHDYNHFSGLSVSWGLRFVLYNQLGPAEIYNYTSGMPRAKEFITDTSFIEPGRKVAVYPSLEPRIALKYYLNDHFTLKMSYTRSKQFIHLYSNTSNITPTDVWVPSDRTIKPQSGDQFSLGLFSVENGSLMEISVEVYYKLIHNLMDVKGGAELLMNSHLEADLLSGKGRAYGAEGMLRFSGRLNGWLAYSLSRSERIVDDKTQNSSINKGYWYPSDYDRPHDLKIFLNYRLNARFQASCNFIYSSGRPATFPTAYYLTQNIPVVYYSERNQFRLPDYKRVDISLSMDLTTKKTKKWKSEITFSIYNLAGWDNTYSVFFRNENDLNLNAWQVLMINRAVPSVSWNFNF